MLKHSFIHIHGIGQKKELQYWEKGIFYIDQLYRLVKPQADLFGVLSLSSSLYDELSKSSEAIESGNADYFAYNLPRSELYRIALAYPNLSFS